MESIIRNETTKKVIMYTTALAGLYVTATAAIHHLNASYYQEVLHRFMRQLKLALQEEIKATSTNSPQDLRSIFATIDQDINYLMSCYKSMETNLQAHSADPNARTSFIGSIVELYFNSSKCSEKSLFRMTQEIIKTNNETYNNFLAYLTTSPKIMRLFCLMMSAKNSVASIKSQDQFSLWNNIRIYLSSDTITLEESNLEKEFFKTIGINNESDYSLFYELLYLNNRNQLRGLVSCTASSENKFIEKLFECTSEDQIFNLDGCFLEYCMQIVQAVNSIRAQLKDCRSELHDLMTDTEILKCLIISMKITASDRMTFLSEDPHVISTISMIIMELIEAIIDDTSKEKNQFNHLVNWLNGINTSTEKKYTGLQGCLRYLIKDALTRRLTDELSVNTPKDINLSDLQKEVLPIIGETDILNIVKANQRYISLLLAGAIRKFNQDHPSDLSPDTPAALNPDITGIDRYLYEIIVQLKHYKIEPQHSLEGSTSETTAQLVIYEEPQMQVGSSMTNGTEV